MKYLFSKGSTSIIVPVFIQDSSSTTGAGLAGLTEASSIVGGYVRAGATGVALAVDENVTTEGTYQAPSAAGKVRIGTPANMRAGTYELHLHNDLLASGADAVLITLGGASNMADLVLEIQLTDIDVNDGVRGGMTSLANAAADAPGGTPISDAGGLDLDALYAAAVRLTAARAQVLDDWIDAGRLDTLLDAILLDTGSTLPTSHAVTQSTIAALNDLSAADINTEVADVMKTDTIAERSQGAPPTTPTIEEVLMYLYQREIYKRTLGSGLDKMFASDGSTVICKATVTDDMTTATKEEFISGA